MDHPECMYQSRMGSSNNDSNKGHNGGNMRQARDRELSLTVTTLSDSGVENREGTAECGPCNCESMKRREGLVVNLLANMTNTCGESWKATGCRYVRVR